MGIGGEIKAKEVSIRKLFIDIDLDRAEDINSLHKLLSLNLNFPKFYGMNWDAFWDAITGLVPMPRTLTLNGWDKFEEKFKDDAYKLKYLLEEYRGKYNDKFRVIYN